MAIPILWTALASIAVFFAVRLTLALLSAGGPGEERSLDGVLRPSESTVVVLDHRPDAVPALSRLLSRTATQRQIQLSIIRAGMMLRPSELISLSGSLALLGLLLGWALKGPILGVLVCLLFGAGPWIYVSVRQEMRKKALMHQLADAMDMMCSSLRAGYGFGQAMKTVSEQFRPPLGAEAARVVDEMGVGLSLDQALSRMITRTDQQDVDLMCTAVQIQTRTGGNLADILATMSTVIRDRVRLEGEIAALTAEGRMSALVLIALPLAVALGLQGMHPGWLRPLVTDIVGQLILGAGILLYLLGIFVLYRMLKVDF